MNHLSTLNPASAAVIGLLSTALVLYLAGFRLEVDPRRIRLYKLLRRVPWRNWIARRLGGAAEWMLAGVAQMQRFVRWQKQLHWAWKLAGSLPLIAVNVAFFVAAMAIIGIVQLMKLIMFFVE